MKKFLAPALTLFLVAAALSGCGKTSKPASPSETSGVIGMNGATAVDVAQTSDAVTANPTLVDENLSTDDASTLASAMATLDHPGLGRHRPLRWWRTIDSTSRTVTFVFGDNDSLGRPTTAIATVHRHILGKFHLVIFDSTATDSMRRVVLKPIDESWTRKLALHRFHIATDSTGTHSMWRIVGTSGALVTSLDATVNIQSVRVQAGTLDTTITDPLELHRLRRFECFRGLQIVHLTVTTTHNDDIVVLHRLGDRRPFIVNGDGTYSIEFIGWDFGGLGHMSIDALSNGTVTSETDPYDSQAWVLPFVARPGDAAINSH